MDAVWPIDHHYEIALMEFTTKTIQGVGKSIEQANAKYEKAWRKLHKGPGSLTTKTEELKELGATTKKTLPKELLDDAEVNPLIEEK